jgi:hypothetical protein
MGARAAPPADAVPAPVAFGADEAPEFIVPVDDMPVAPTEGPVDPASAFVLPLPAVPLPDARTRGGNTRGPSFRTSSGHGAEALVDSVAEVQRLLLRSASTPGRLGPGAVWASAEPASKSAASGASGTGKHLFMAYSFPTAAGG